MNDERIDRYALGKMSDEERLAFEQELNENAELKDEATLHSDIVRAIRMKGAKSFLQKVEQEIQQSEYAKKVHRRRLIMRISSCFAVAACLVVGIFHFHQVSIYKSVGNDCFELLKNAETSRGGFDSSSIITLIDNNDYDKALTIIAEEQSQLSNDDSLDILDNDELEWYKVITYMRMGKWVKARKLLKQIASSDSSYKEQAQEVLDRL